MIPGALFAFLLAIVYGLLDHSFFGLEDISLDLRFQLRGPLDVSHSPIILIEVDNRSYKDLNERFPFPREHYARVIHNLRRAGVGMVVMDIQFTEKVTGDEAGLEALADELAREGIVILSGELVQDRRHYSRLDPPLPELLASGQPWGLINDLNDRDGVNRLYPLYWPSPGNGDPLPSLGLQVLMNELGESTIPEPADGYLRLKDRELLLEPGYGNAIRINYHGPAGSFPTYSFSSIMDDAEFQLAEEDFDTDYIEQFADSMLFDLLWEGEEHPFRGKIALVGVSATDLHDNKRTPYFHYKGDTRLMPGVETHAHALQTLLDGAWIRRPFSGGATLILPALASLLGVMITGLMGPFRALFLLLPMMAAYLGLGQLLFNRGNIWLDLVTTLVALVGAWVFGLLQQFLAARRERAQIRGMFAQYVPEAVVAELIKSPEKLVLGGEEREMSAIFSDVEGFTSISERLSPRELVELLNEYLTAMTEEITAMGGIIDKYEGDAIIAEFGAPLPAADHAKRAAESAIRMQRVLARLREGWEKEGKPLLKARIGINSGPMVVGNMGSRQIFDYTAMGDAMNLASRLEGVNKFYRSWCMCSRDTWNQLGDAFLGRPLDLIRVKGKDEAVEIWEVLEMRQGLASADLERLENRITAWQAARELYLKRQWQAAARAFSSIRESYPEDGPADVFARRCDTYTAEPPAADWDGVETMKEK